MNLKRIVLTGIIFAICLYKSLSFAQCPPGYPVDCGNDYCCSTIEWCPEEGELISYECIQKEKCLFITIFGEYSEKVELLRNIRDNVMNTTPEGREIIKLYYEWNPVIAKAMEEDEEFKEQVKKMVDGVLPLLNIGIEW